MRRAYAAGGARVRGVAGRRAAAGTAAVARGRRQPAAGAACARQPVRRAARRRETCLQAKGNVNEKLICLH